jgi:hypothetical protein
LRQHGILLGLQLHEKQTRIGGAPARGEHGVFLVVVCLQGLVDAEWASEEVDMLEAAGAVGRRVEHALEEVLVAAAVRVCRTAHDDERRQVDKGGRDGGRLGRSNAGDGCRNAERRDAHRKSAHLVRIARTHCRRPPPRFLWQPIARAST